MATALGGEDMSYLHGEHAKYPVPVRVELPAGTRRLGGSLQALRVRSAERRAGAAVRDRGYPQRAREQTIYHKDLLPVVYVDR